MRGLFVTATGTGVGKTTVTCALARALRACGREVVALKPIETGLVDGVAADARALADACGRPELASDPRWYRARAPLCPYAASLEGEAVPDLGALADVAREVSRGHVALVEGAGGLLVPLTRDTTIADLAASLDLPLLVVAPDRLGVLSDALTTIECAERRGLRVAALVLNRFGEGDPSVTSNARILAERLPQVLIASLRDGHKLPESLVNIVARS